MAPDLPVAAWREGASGQSAIAAPLAAPGGAKGIEPALGDAPGVRGDEARCRVPGDGEDTGRSLRVSVARGRVGSRAGRIVLLAQVERVCWAARGLVHVAGIGQ